MNALTPLLACAGQWQGTNTLQDPMTNTPDSSLATAVMTAVLDGRFARFDYTWRYQDTPQEGALLMGYDHSAQQVTAYWIDSWHMGDKGMLCTGDTPTDGAFSVRGSYAAGDGPAWGWRITVDCADDGQLRMVMNNISPDGQEALAVEALYRRL
jgi:hypothetical protein